MKKMALYARVSTNNGSQDAEVQLSRLREYSKQRQLNIYKEYVDHMSGSCDDRPGFKRMMQDARKRKLDAVMVWKFDRFARSTKALVLALDEFKTLGVDFISYSEQVDTSTPMGKAMFIMISAIAEFERSLIAERVVAGLQRAKEKGVKLGRPRVAVNIQEAIRLRDEEDLGYKQIAKHLGLPRTTLYRTLRAIPKTSALNQR